MSAGTDRGVMMLWDKIAPSGTKANGKTLQLKKDGIIRFKKGTGVS